MNFDEPSRCRSCGAAIIWCTTTAGKAMPVDEAPAPGGNLWIDGDGTARVLFPLEAQQRAGQMHLSHFATCPQAAQHRRRR